MTTFTSSPESGLSYRPRSEDALVLLADFQAGIADLPLTVPEARLRKNLAALLNLTQIFDLPCIVTAVPGAEGEVSALTPELQHRMAPGQVRIRTSPNSMDNAGIRSAIEKAGRRSIFIGGVATEVAVGLPALTLASEGYDVHVLVDVCGGMGLRTEAAMHARLVQADVKLTSLPTMIGELVNDFSEPSGQAAIGVLFELAESETPKAQ